jgi:hypothetical protein
MVVGVAWPVPAVEGVPLLIFRRVSSGFGLVHVDLCNLPFLVLPDDSRLEHSAHQALLLNTNIPSPACASNLQKEQFALT